MPRTDLAGQIPKFQWVSRRGISARSIFCGGQVLPEAIKGPCFRMDHTMPVGPSWDEVQRLLRCEKQDTPASMRVQVLLLLFSLYGLRTSEATRLLLNNFDRNVKRS